MNKISLCPVHQQEPIQFICVDKDCKFDRNICYECLYTNHYQHKSIQISILKKKNLHIIKEILDQTNYKSYQEIFDIIKTSMNQQTTQKINKSFSSKLKARMTEIKKQFCLKMQLYEEKLNEQVIQINSNSDEFKEQQQYFDKLDNIFNLNELISLCTQFQSEEKEKNGKDIVNFYNLSLQNIDEQEVQKLQDDINTNQEFTKLVNSFIEKISDQNFKIFDQFEIQNNKNLDDLIQENNVIIENVNKIKQSEEEISFKKQNNIKYNLQIPKNFNLPIMKYLSPIMKINNCQKNHYNDKFWSPSEQSLNSSDDFSKSQFEGPNILYTHYKNKFKYFIIESIKDEQTVEWIKLENKSDMSILEMRKSYNYYDLKYIDGQENPIQLFLNHESSNQHKFPNKKIQWQINKDCILGGNVWYYGQNKDTMEFCDWSAIGINKELIDTKICSGCYIDFNNYPHLGKPKAKLQINVYGLNDI